MRPRLDRVRREHVERCLQRRHGLLDRTRVHHHAKAAAAAAAAAAATTAAATATAALRHGDPRVARVRVDAVVQPLLRGAVVREARPGLEVNQVEQHRVAAPRTEEAIFAQVLLQRGQPKAPGKLRAHSPDELFEDLARLRVRLEVPGELLERHLRRLARRLPAELLGGVAEHLVLQRRLAGRERLD